MSEDQARAQQQESAEARNAGSGDGDDEGPPSTPFDSPYFLPVLIWGFTLYFGYDAWISNHEYQKFNRFGFGLGLAASLYYTATAFRPRPFMLTAAWAGLGLWFGYMALLADGWWNQGEEAAVGSAFTQGFFGVAVLMTLISGLRAWLRERRAAASAPASGGS